MPIQIEIVSKCPQIIRVCEENKQPGYLYGLHILEDNEQMIELYENKLYDHMEQGNGRTILYYMKTSNKRILTLLSTKYEWEYCNNNNEINIIEMIVSHDDYKISVTSVKTINPGMTYNGGRSVNKNKYIIEFDVKDNKYYYKTNNNCGQCVYVLADRPDGNKTKREFKHSSLYSHCGGGSSINMRYQSVHQDVSIKNLLGSHVKTYPIIQTSEEILENKIKELELIIQQKDQIIKQQEKQVKDDNERFGRIILKYEKTKESHQEKIDKLNQIIEQFGDSDELELICI